MDSVKLDALVAADGALVVAAQVGDTVLVKLASGALRPLLVTTTYPDGDVKLKAAPGSVRGWVFLDPDLDDGDNWARSMSVHTYVHDAKPKFCYIPVAPGDGIGQYRRRG